MGKVKWTPVILQMEALECGAASLAMIMAYYDKWVTLEDARHICGVSRDGSRASNILKAARYYGFEADGFRVEADDIEKTIKLPAIVYWENRHFVVLCGIKNGKYMINDPSCGKVYMSREDFRKSYSGICLQIVPGPDFCKGGHRDSVIKFIWERLRQTKAALIFVTVVSIIAAVFSMITPLFDEHFYEDILSGNTSSGGRLVTFLIIFTAFAVLEFIFAWIRSSLSYKMSGRIDVDGRKRFFKKLLTFPIPFYQQRQAGDLAMRQSSTALVASTIVNAIGPLLINVVMTIIYLVVMIRYSLLLALVGVAALALSIIVSVLSQNTKTNLSRLELRDHSELYVASLNAVEIEETVKALGAEQKIMENWSEKQKVFNHGLKKEMILDSCLNILPETVTRLAGAVVTIIGVCMIAGGNFTLGALSAFSGFLTAFMTPATTLVTAGAELRTTRADMERQDDVMKNPSDPLVEHNVVVTDEDTWKLGGDIELANVSFGYSPLDPPIIKNISINIKKGQSVAFVGASGSGKSTIAKLVSGLYKPWDGSVTFSGKSISEIPRNIFNGSVAVVDQNITLFSDTVRSNIKLWDDSIEDFEMILAARDASIYDAIDSRKKGFDEKLSANSMGFSGGEMQRIEIARALAQDPTIIIMDEATSALDAITEKKVAQAIEERGITSIIIAHRLSTIRDCDQIIVLNHGEIVERGTHQELMELGGYYTQLVSDE